MSSFAIYAGIVPIYISIQADIFLKIYKGMGFWYIKMAYIRTLYLWTETLKDAFKHINLNIERGIYIIVSPCCGYNTKP